jgi:hypothetical protein
MYKKHTDEVLNILASPDITEDMKERAGHCLDQAYKLKRGEAVRRDRRLQTLPLALPAYMDVRCHSCKLKRLACAPEAVAIAYLIRLWGRI